MHKKTSKVLHRKLFDQKIYTLFQGGSHNRPKWPFFGLYPFFRRANARNVSFRVSLWWLNHFINPVGKTKLSCYSSNRRSTAVYLEIFLLLNQA